MRGPRGDLHRARLEAWTPDALKAHLGTIVDGLVTEKDRGGGSLDIAPLDVALELLGGELEAFVLFGRMGHLDPPRADGKVPIAVLRRMSSDPEIDVAIRDTARKWAAEQEERS